MTSGTPLSEADTVGFAGFRALLSISLLLFLCHFHGFRLGRGPDGFGLTAEHQHCKAFCLGFRVGVQTHVFSPLTLFCELLAWSPPFPLLLRFPAHLALEEPPSSFSQLPWLQAKLPL